MEGIIKTTSGKEAKLTFSLRTLDKEERRKHALKGLGLFWALAIASVPLPPIHWVTVPGFFAFGIYWAVRKWREGIYFEEIVFLCPECKAEVRLAPQEMRNPLSFVCPHCRYGLKLRFGEVAV